MIKKEYLYVGHYYDEQDNYILKIGKTNDLERRKKEHNRVYKRSKKHTMKSEFEYDWYKSLSKYSVERYEDLNRETLKEQIGGFIKNDRFILKDKPKEIVITIRKEYRIVLWEWGKTPLPHIK